MKLVLLLAALFGTVYGFVNDFAFDILCFGFAMLVAASMRWWFAWCVWLAAVLALGQGIRI